VSAVDWSDRFWSRVHPEALSGCWLWHGKVRHDGYGVLGFNSKYRAHHVAYEKVNGARLPGTVVMHTCDVPGCVNPEHLRLGTQQENLADMHRKGRARGNAKLTEEAVLEVRRRLAAGDLQREIAADMRVTQSAISDIKRRFRWERVGDDNE